MPIKTHTCLSVACDVCTAPLEGEGGGTIHVQTSADARMIARGFLWSVLSDGRFVCPIEDSAHQAAMDELMPAEPVMQVPGQLGFDGEVSS